MNNLGILTFFISLFCIAIFLIGLLLTLIVYLVNRKAKHYKRPLAVALWALLIGGISLLLTAIFCSGI